MNISSAVKNNEFLMAVNDKFKELFYKYLITDKMLIKLRFKHRLGRKLNLENPTKLNDKLQWLKLYWYDPLAAKCADKYEVREYIKNTIGSKYLNEIYGVYESVDDINIDELPKSFVLKGTHGSGFNIICKDKNKMDWSKEFKKMKRWLRTNYYWSKREWVYRDIKPRIICEKFIEQDNGEELRDYRFFCFNGVPKFIAVDLNINDKNNTRRNLYDLDWNLMEEEITYPKDQNINLEKPAELEQMIKLAEKLSSRFPHSRVDFYYTNNKIIFSEITFFHQSGMGKFNPPEFEEELGSYLILPQKK